jgi:hypothetical protein
MATDRGTPARSNVRTADRRMSSTSAPGPPEKRFVEPVELLLNRLDAALLLRHPLVRYCPPLLPNVKEG